MGGGGGGGGKLSEMKQTNNKRRDLIEVNLQLCRYEQRWQATAFCFEGDISMEWIEVSPNSAKIKRLLTLTYKFFFCFILTFA